MAADISRSSTSSADTYIGSLISLTSKSEIRYEGILYNINTEESSIGLRNVRSFGSEGRKKDGPQIMPSDKVYEYILFRGSDIKDLQVSRPVQPTQPINSDPAIIQSQYPRPNLTPSTLPPTATTGNSFPDQNTPTPQPGQQHPGIPLYQPDGKIKSWGPQPPPPNVNTSSLPMYWPGFYPQLHQQSMFRPMQYPNFNSPLPGGPPNLPEYPSPSLPTSSATSANLTSTSLLGSSLPPVPPLLFTTEPLPNFLQTKPPNNPVDNVTPDVNVTIPSVSSMSSVLSDGNLVYQGKSLLSESPSLSLVTPGQLKDAVVTSSLSSEGVVRKDVGPAPLLEPSVAVAVSVPVPTEAQPPLLPLPTQPRNASKTNGAPYHNHHNYRGRGSGVSRPAMNFTEEFDFTAMNEKFNKDEVWGTLGKTNKNSSQDRDGNITDEDELQDQNNTVLPKYDVKPVYSKDDFFDTLSCNSNDRQSNNGQTRFSEQMKLDTETFGEFSRYRGGRGGRGPYRGGRSRGGGYYGRGYGYVNRGRGGRIPTRDY